MADGAFTTLISKDRLVNAAANPIFTQLTDGTTVLSTTGGALDVNVDNTVTIQDGGNTITVDGSVSITGSVTVTFNGQEVDDAAFGVATDTVLAIGMLADETAPDSVDEGDIGIPRMTLNRRQLMVIGDKTTDANRLTVNSDGSINVNITSATTITGEIHDYDTSSGVAADATDNHDYTVANTTFLLKSVIFSGSGNVKAEIQTGPVASLVTKAVGFLNGRQGDTKQLFFDPAIEVPVTSTGTVRVIRTNRQGSATDVYSTIIGIDI